MIIFKISSFKEAILNNSLPKAKYLSALYSGFSLWIFLLITSALLTGCGSSKHIQTQIVKEIQLDTMYLSTEKYDSIYITQDRYIDRSRDTIHIRESNTEYRYRLLRDTIKEVRVDSISYEVRITETIEVPRKLTWYDHTARATFWLLIGFILLCLYRRFHKQYARHPLAVTLSPRLQPTERTFKENFGLLYSLSNPHAEPVLSQSKDETREDFL